MVERVIFAALPFVGTLADANTAQEASAFSSAACLGLERSQLSLCKKRENTSKPSAIIFVVEYKKSNHRRLSVQ